MTFTILSLCDFTGNWSRPYRDAGYDVRQVDLWGNRHDAAVIGHSLAVEMFRRDIDEGAAGWPGRGLPLSRAMIQTRLRGKNLSCWCSLDQPCHADILLKLANET